MQPRAPSPSPPGQPSVALARFQGHDPRGGPARGVSPSVISLARSLAATCTDLDLAGCQHRAVAPGAARWALLPMASTAATTYVEPSLAARRRWPPRRRPRSLCGGRRLGRPSTWSVPTVAKHAPQPSGSARCQGSPRRGGGGAQQRLRYTYARPGSAAAECVPYCLPSQSRRARHSVRWCAWRQRPRPRRDVQGTSLSSTAERREPRANRLVSSRKAPLPRGNSRGGPTDFRRTGPACLERSHAGTAVGAAPPCRCERARPCAAA